MKDILILGIETSCDETSASVVKNGVRCFQMLSHPRLLFIKIWRVVPEIASRKHVELIMPVIHQSLEEAGIKIEQVDAIGVTYGPVWSEPSGRTFGG